MNRKIANTSLPGVLNFWVTNLEFSIIIFLYNEIELYKNLYIVDIVD